VANAGLILVATMAARLDLEALIDATVRLAGRVGGHRPGRKVMTFVHAIVAGGSHIDHADVLRAGATGRVLGGVRESDAPIDVKRVGGDFSCHLVQAAVAAVLVVRVSQRMLYISRAT
jgi:hypothetical protein